MHQKNYKMTNQTTFDPDVQPSARDRAGSISPTSMSSANTPDNSMVATSVTCNSPYRILSLSDMVDEDKDDCDLDSDSDGFIDHEASGEETYPSLSSCCDFMTVSDLNSSSENQASEVVAGLSDITPTWSQQTVPSHKLTEKNTNTEACAVTKYPSSENQKPRDSSKMREINSILLARNFYKNFQPSDHTINETVNTQCYEAALSECISNKGHLKLAEIGSRLKNNKLKQQSGGDTQHSRSGVGGLGIKNVADRRKVLLPQLKKLYQSVQARADLKQASGGSPFLLNTDKSFTALFKQFENCGQTSRNVFSSPSFLGQLEEGDNCNNQVDPRCALSPELHSPETTDVGNLSPTSESVSSTNQFPVLSTIPNSLEQFTPSINTDCTTASHPITNMVSSSQSYSESGGVSVGETKAGSHVNTLKMKSFGLKYNPEMKKYRYNQTALALQQSGLMKTTVRTAELLRKSRMLQQELVKLKKETTAFVTSVLNNPENKHLKDMYAHLLNQKGSDLR